MKWAFLLTAALLAQPAPAPDAVPQDAIPAILELFKTYRVVGLGEGAHGNEQGHRFRLSLIRDPRFPASVHDIVVEMGNARCHAEVIALRGYVRSRLARAARARAKVRRSF